jgi:hypothetical protein
VAGPYGGAPGVGFPQQGPPAAGPYGGAPGVGFPQQGPPAMGPPLPQQPGVGTKSNWFFPQPEPLPYAISQDELMELRQAALFGKKAPPKHDKTLQEFTAIDGGARPKFNAAGLVLGLFGLGIWTKKRGLLTFAAVFALQIILLLIFRQNITIVTWAIWICSWIFSGFVLNGWMYYTIGNEISKTLKLCQGNIEQSKAILVRNPTKTRILGLLSVLILLVYTLSYPYLYYNLPTCSNKAFLPTVKYYIYEIISKQTNLSKDYLTKNVSLEITNIKSDSNRFQNCDCSAAVTISEANGEPVTRNITFSVDSSEGTLTQVHILVRLI